MRRRNCIDSIDDHAEAITHVDYRSIDSGTAAGIKDQTHRISLSSNAQRMNLKRWPFVSNRRTNLQHMRAQHHAPVSEIVGVVLHERRSTFESGAHHFHRAHQRCCLPVALSTEAVSVCHQALHGYSWQLREPMQVFKGIREGFEVAVLKEMAESQFNFRGLSQGGPLLSACP